MDDSRVQKRRNIKSFLFGESSFCRRFEYAPENSFREKNEETEINFKAGAKWRRSSSQGRNSASSEGTSSLGSDISKGWKSPLVRSLSWIKWKLLNSLSKYYNPSHHTQSKIYSFFIFNIKHPISSSCERSKPCIEMIEQRKLGFQNLEKVTDKMTVKGNIEAVLRKESVNCSSPTRNSEDTEGCASSENKFEDREICSEKEKCGAHDGVEACFEQKTRHGLPANEQLLYRKKYLRCYPPPLPSLARTGNLPSHMPWVHLRSYKRDGRLVIQEVKVQHHEFLRAKRSNGRLIMHLVQHDEAKVRANQAENIESEYYGTGVGPSDEESIDEAKENGRIEIEEAPGEMIEALPHDGGHKDEADETSGFDNCDKDEVVEKEEVLGLDEDSEDLSNCRGEQKISANFGKNERQVRLPNPIRVPVQQCFPGIGLESPIGCCAPQMNSLFGRSITAVRPIRS